MARSASADIMCVGPKSVREKFTGIIWFAILILLCGFSLTLAITWEIKRGSKGLEEL